MLQMTANILGNAMKAMPFSHILLAILVALIWGVNFLFVKIGLKEIPPLLLCAIRFILASIPAIFFIKRPQAPFKKIAAYGLVMFALQFSLIFVGLSVGMTPGMGSLLIQTQIFFSMFFAAMVLGEIPSFWQVLGAIVSFSGIGLVAFHFDKHISLVGFLFILAGAATWGAGNLINKQIKNVNMISLVVWGSFIASFPMLAISLFVEGPQSIFSAYHHLTWHGISSVMYIVYISTWVGYGVWSLLLSRYPVSSVVPFTLLVPIVGLITSVIFLGEPLQPWKIVAGLLVLSGLCINLLGARLFVREVPQELETKTT